MALFSRDGYSPSPIYSSANYLEVINTAAEALFVVSQHEVDAIAATHRHGRFVGPPMCGSLTDAKRAVPGV